MVTKMNEIIKHMEQTLPNKSIITITIQTNFKPQIFDGEDYKGKFRCFVCGEEEKRSD